MPSRGDSFHRLVEYLERAVSEDPRVTIESSKRLLDKVTGRPREHDIVLTHRLPQRQIVTAIECRDRSRPVTVEQVEAFQTKCRDTGVDKGVIVSSRGFCNTAREKATRYGIDCLTFREVASVDWCEQRDVVISHKHPQHTNVHIGAPFSLQGKGARLFYRTVNGPDEDTGIRLLANDAGEFLADYQPNSQFVGSAFITASKQNPIPPDVQAGVFEIEIGNLDDFYFLDGEMVEHPLEWLELEVRWVSTETRSPLTFHHYGADVEKPAFEALTTAVEELGDIQGRVMLVADGQRRLRLKLVPEKKNTLSANASVPSADDQTILD